jgi:hypothetical protein
MLVVGPIALVFFYFPIFFLSRPLRPWRRIILWQHWLSLSLLAVAVLCWIFMAPGYLQLDAGELDGGGNYVLRFLAFPFLAAGSYMPWLLVTWPAFCAAFTHLEPSRVLGRFLRTIVFTVIVVVWLLPDAPMTLLQPLVGPLAILTGMHYRLVMRRYARQMMLVPRIVSVIAMAAVFTGFAALFLLQMDIVGTALPAGLATQILFLLGFGAVVSVLSVGLRKRLPLWASVAIGIVALQSVRACASQVFGRHDFVHQAIAESLLADVPANATIYINENRQDAEQVRPGPIVGYYLQRDLARMTTRFDVGGDEPVYVLQQNHTPTNRYRQWTPVGQPTEVGDQRLRIWCGRRSAVPPPPAPDTTLTLPPVPLSIPGPDSPLPVMNSP